MSDITKLPAWARSYIEKLESDLQWHKEAYQAVSGDTPSPVRCSDTINPPLHLPARNTIEMDVQGGTLELSLRNGVLELRADKAILVQSSAGNVLKAWVK